jgi:hypothetical protein
MIQEGYKFSCHTGTFIVTRVNRQGRDCWVNLMYYSDVDPKYNYSDSWDVKRLNDLIKNNFYIW